MWRQEPRLLIRHQIGCINVFAPLPCLVFAPILVAVELGLKIASRFGMDFTWLIPLWWHCGHCVGVALLCPLIHAASSMDGVIMSGWSYSCYLPLLWVADLLPCHCSSPTPFFVVRVLSALIVSVFFFCKSYCSSSAPCVPFCLQLLLVFYVSFLSLLLLTFSPVSWESTCCAGSSM